MWCKSVMYDIKTEEKWRNKNKKKSVIFDFPFLSFLVLLVIYASLICDFFFYPVAIWFIFCFSFYMMKNGGKMADADI